MHYSLGTRRSGQARVVGKQRDLGSVSQAGLGQDVGHVRLDGGHAHQEGGGDLGVRLALGDGPDDFALPRAQVLKLPERLLPGILLHHGAAHQPTGHGGGEDRGTVGGASFSRKPLAPARSAPSTFSSASNVVRTMTSGGWVMLRSRRVALIPSTRGIRRSISTTSGRCFATAPCT